MLFGTLYIIGVCWLTYLLMMYFENHRTYTLGSCISSVNSIHMFVRTIREHIISVLDMFKFLVVIYKNKSGRPITVRENPFPSNCSHIPLDIVSRSKFSYFRRLRCGLFFCFC